MKSILALGETSHGVHLDEIRKILENYKDLSGIFLELPSDYQNSIDYYFQNKEVDKKLQKFWGGSLNEGNDIKSTIMYLLDFALERKISVVCIDSSKTQTSEYSKKSDIGHWFLRSNSRDEDMYENIVRKYKEGERWIVLCGSGHLVCDIHPRSGKKTLGARLENKFKDRFSYILLSSK